MKQTKKLTLKKRQCIDESNIQSVKIYKFEYDKLHPRQRMRVNVTYFISEFLDDILINNVSDLPKEVHSQRAFL